MTGDVRRLESGDVQRLESERLRPSPPPPSWRDTMDQVVAVLYAAIRDDQAAGTWGAR